MFIIWWIIVGLIAGFLPGKLMKGSGYGAIGDIVIGIIVGGVANGSLPIGAEIVGPYKNIETLYDSLTPYTHESA
jgi:uncharacterized membrane protein YeaQ/YmgE (transglycosylase-associated protein family)